MAKIARQECKELLAWFSYGTWTRRTSTEQRETRTIYTDTHEVIGEQVETIRAWQTIRHTRAGKELDT